MTPFDSLKFLPHKTLSDVRQWANDAELPATAPLSQWFSNFPDLEEKKLAAKLLCQFRYYSGARFNAALDELGNALRQTMAKDSVDLETAIYICDSDYLDSSHPMIYAASKSGFWSLASDRVHSVETLPAPGTKSISAIVVLNDTQGSGNQFTTKVWPAISKHCELGTRAYVACLVGAKPARQQISALSNQIKFVAGISHAICLQDLVDDGTFSGEEASLIRAISERANAQLPKGYGDCELLVAYDYQCPNNTLPVFWGDGNCSRRGKNWIPLFEYRRKVRTPSAPKHDAGKAVSPPTDSKAQRAVPGSTAPTIEPSHTGFGAVRVPRNHVSFQAALALLTPPRLSDLDGRPSTLPSLDRLDQYFQGLICQDGQASETPVSDLYRDLGNASPDRGAVHLVGARGSGKMLIISVVFLELRQAGKLPLFIDFSRESTQRLLDALKLVLGAKESAGKDVILIQYSPPSDPGSIPLQLQDQLSRGTTLFAHATQQQWPGCFQILEAGVGSVTGAEKYLNLASLKQRVSNVYKDVEPSLIHEFADSCRRHRCAPDLFLATQYHDSRAQGISKKNRSLSDLMFRFITTTVEALGEKRTVGLKKPTNRGAASVKSLARFAYLVYTEFQGEDDTAEHKNHRWLWDTISTISPHVENWLIAYGSLLTLSDLHHAQRVKNEAHARDLARKLNFVHSTSVNAFTRSLIQGEGFRIDAALWDWMFRLLRDQRVSEILLKANVCYLMGRSGDPVRRPETLAALGDVLKSTSDVLSAIECVRGIVHHSAKMDALTRRATHPLLARFNIPPEADESQKLALLNQLENQILLCQRSSAISSAMLGDIRAANSYVKRLSRSIREDDLNRGFHLVYYGDLPYRPAHPLISTDQEGVDCSRTVTSLIRSISDSSEPEASRIIQVYTLLSLVRDRVCCTTSMPSQRKSAISPEVVQQSLSVCEQYLKSTPKLPKDIRLWIDHAMRHIAWGDYLVESIVDDMYEMKHLTRTGWEGLLPEEPLASHGYFVRILAGILLKTNSTSQPHAKASPAELTLYHDIGESILGDIPIHLKLPSHTEDENRIVSIISGLGAITGSTEASKVYSMFSEFENKSNRTIAAKIAKDMDKLDLLIQFHRYKRLGLAIPREEQFVAYISSADFESDEGQFWAERFHRYFDSEASRRIVRNIWPIVPAKRPTAQTT